MKYSFVLLCMFLSVNILAQSYVADFEESEISPVAEDTIWASTSNNAFVSGSVFSFQQEVSNYGGVYYYAGSIVSNQVDTIYGYYADAYNAACGAAHSGSNYLVWYPSWYGYDSVLMAQPMQMEGVYLNNTTWVTDAIVYGDHMGGNVFSSDDWISLTINGWAFVNQQPVSTGSVVYYLAKDGEYLMNWTWCDLSSLGTIDALTFVLDGSQYNEYGLSTPTYFCLDDLTASVPTSLQQTDRDGSAGSVVLTSRGLRIERDGMLYDLLGRRLF